jgi:ribosomal protein S11
MNITIKVTSTYNNTIVSALYKGKILKTISTGSLGFKKAKRASTLAAQMCGEALGSWLLLLNKNVTRNSLTKRELNLSSLSSPSQRVNKIDPKGEDQIDSKSLISQEVLNKQSEKIGNKKIIEEQEKKNKSIIGTNFSLKEKIEYSMLLDAKKKLLNFAGGKQNQQKALNKKGSKLNKINEKNNLTSLSLVEVNNKDLNNVPPIAKMTKMSEQKNIPFNICNNISLLIAGVGYGKFGVIRGLSKLGIKIKTICDVTAVPHNGCKPPKMRRK